MSYKIKIKDYDKAVKEVCEEKEVTYVDLKDINDYHKNKRTKYDGQEDILHFNQEFNIKLVNILYSYIYDLELERRQNENKKN